MSNLSKINNQELLNFIRGDEYQGPISFAAQDLGVSEALIDFIRDEHIKVEGSFSANNQLYVIYSKIVTPSELEAVKDKGIFASLKLYGFSGKYKGVVDAKGKSIIPNMYYTITPFMNNIMKIEYKGNKFGLMRLSGEIILEPKYDRIDPLGELVFAVSFGGKLGFMNLNGQEVIPFMYEIPDNEVVLTDYDAWHFVLNKWYLNIDCDDELTWDKDHAWLDTLSAKEITGNLANSLAGKNTMPII